MLNIIKAFYRPKGEEPSRWIGPGEFEQFASIAHGYGLFSTGGRHGLCAEVAFGDDTALIIADAGQPHPQLGHGLLLLLKLPVTLAKPAADHLAIELNAAEANTLAGSHLLGGWCSDEIAGDRQFPVFASFVPNAAYRPGLLATLILSLAQKARWARRHIAPYAADTGVPFLLRGERPLPADTLVIGPVPRRPNPPEREIAEPAPRAPKPAWVPPPGARQAPNGHWYLPDPERPGKYLLVPESTAHEAVLAAIGRLSFRFARTTPDEPHEYTVREPESAALEAAFVTLFETILRDGRPGSYRGATYRYLDPGDGWMYWAMTDNLVEGRLINRARA